VTSSAGAARTCTMRSVSVSPSRMTLFKCLGSNRGSRGPPASPSRCSFTGCSTFEPQPSCTKARSRDYAGPYEYLPDVTEGRDDWAEWEAMMASPSTDIVPNAWETLVGRLTPAQREAAMRPGSALVLAGAGTGKTSTLTASVVHKIEVENLPASRLLVGTASESQPAPAEFAFCR